MSCQCDVCEEYREFRRQIELLPEANREYFVNLYSKYTDVSYDLDYYKFKVKELKVNSLHS